MRRLLVPVLLLVAVLAGSLLTGCGAGDAGEPVTVPASESAATEGSGVPGNGSAVRNPSTLPEIKESALPPEARETLARIRAGGLYPYRQDDETFGNFERLLPRQPSGYYREYTVETPGEDDRGARRIVTGDGGEKYYTSDHYDSFRFIVEGS